MLFCRGEKSQSSLALTFRVFSWQFKNHSTAPPPPSRTHTRTQTDITKMVERKTTKVWTSAHRVPEGTTSHVPFLLLLCTLMRKTVGGFLWLISLLKMLANVSPWNQIHRDLTYQHQKTNTSLLILPLTKHCCQRFLLLSSVLFIILKHEYQSHGNYLELYKKKQVLNEQNLMWANTKTSFCTKWPCHEHKSEYWISS